jgi:AcrR family transcriptional regulator
MAYMRREERRSQILEGAAIFFAENGLNGQTRELSASLGITQPLLYRYFSSKDKLLDCIFKELFEKRWVSSWRDLIKNDSLLISERLTIFYKEFDARILTRAWVRLFVFSGLVGYSYNKRVFRKLMTEIFRPICVELRLFYGLSRVQPSEITQHEIEMVWELHGVIFYHRMRQHVYGVKNTPPIDEIISNLLFYLEGAAPRVLSRLFPNHSINTFDRGKT